jgi:hypothetical protein
MGGTIGGGASNNLPSEAIVRTARLGKSLVVEDVSIVEVQKRIEVPFFVDVPKEQIKYVTKEEETVKYNPVLKETIRYVARDMDTTRYLPKDQETIRYVPIDVAIERPKLIDKEYIIPVIKEKQVEVVSIKNLENIQNVLASLPEVVRILSNVITEVIALTEDIRSVGVEVRKLKGSKLVEEVVRVPKLEYHTVEVERIVWKDVIRERP